MKNSCPFLAFFLLLLVSYGSSDVIQDSCDEAAKSSPNINLDFCVTSLEGDPKSKSATKTKDLVPISIGIAILNVTSTKSTISKLLENKTLKKYTRSCLETCSELYDDAKSNLETSEESFKDKDYGTVNIYLSAALDSPNTCEDGFKEKEGLVSPLTKENNDLLQLTAISLAFVASLK